MRIQKIYSKNAAYQKFEVLKTNRNKRYKYNEFFVEGVRNINEAIRNGWTIQSFLYCPEMGLSNWAKDILRTVKTEVNYELTEALMKEISSKEDTSELLAVVKMRDDRLEDLVLSDNPVIALFDRPSNKGNLGTIIRSCDSFGLDGLLITGHAVDLYEPDVVSSSMGSFFNVHTVRVEDNGCGIPPERLTDIRRAMEKDAGRAEKYFALVNVAARLRSRYGGRASIDLSSRPGEGTEVVIRVPVTA